MGARKAIHAACASVVLGLAWGPMTMAATPLDESIGDVARVERYFEAPADALWRAWTDPKYMSRWFGSDPNGRVLAARADVRVGGTFSVTFADSDGTEHTASGEYREVAPLSRLVFSWQWRSEPGISSQVTVELVPARAGVTMRFEHAGIGYGSAHDYEYGWRRTFDKLARVLAEMP